jgi:hypothetical protein
MKKLLSLAVTALFSLTLFASDPVIVNEKTLQAFQESFKNASDVEWYEHGDSYEVKCMYNDIDSRITYRKDGSVIRVIRYYGGEQLPLLLRAKVQKQFSGKTIYGVTELSQGDKIDYFIVFEDAASWSHVKCSANGETIVYNEFAKS